MVFEELVNEVAERLNLASDEARSRIGRNINTRYRRVTSSIGLETSRRVQVSQAATIGNRFITFTGIEKISAVIDKTSGVDIPLSQISVDEMHITPPRTQPARKFAVYLMHPTSVQVWLDCTPTQGALSATVSTAGTGYVVNDIITLSGGTATTSAKFKVTAIGSGGSVSTVTLSTAGAYSVLPTNPVSTTGGTGSGCALTVTWDTPFTLYADGHTTVSTLSGSQAPDFPESFHDILIFGAMADEYRKMEKINYAQDCEKDFEQRLSDLRMWIAKTAYQDMYQGRYTGKTFRWTRDAQLLSGN